MRLQSIRLASAGSASALYTGRGVSPPASAMAHPGRVASTPAMASASQSAAQRANAAGGSMITRGAATVPPGYALLPAPGREMLQQVPGQRREAVQRRPAAFANAMRAVGVRHEIELLAQRHEAV